MSVAPKLDEVLRHKLGPEQIVADAAGSEDSFVARYGDTQFVMVKLLPGFENVEAGLSTTQRDEGQRVLPSVRVMSFETEVLTQEQVLELELGDGSVQSRLDRLRWLLRNDRYFIMPLRKRTVDATFMDRVSLGRAVNKDVVLRHPNVSKFHAWFEMDDQAALYLADADSRNGTWLNGKRLSARELTRVSSGDHVRFGSIECVACDPRELWQALRS
ncbi:MAG: FHA domain-containing protein [Polyangiales bacterium]